MRLSYLFSLVALLLAGSAAAQSKYRLLVLNREQNRPIANVSIRLVDSRQTFQTDVQGRCTLPVPTGPLQLSCVGYAPAAVQPHKRWHQEDSVYLLPATYTLPEVAVSSAAATRIELQSGTPNYRNTLLAATVRCAVYFPTPTNVVAPQLTSISIPLSNPGKVSEGGLFIRLVRASADGRPLESDLLPTPIMLLPAQINQAKRRTIQLDLSDQPVSLPAEGFCIVLTTTLLKADEILVPDITLAVKQHRYRIQSRSTAVQREVPAVDFIRLTNAQPANPHCRFWSYATSTSTWHPMSTAAFVPAIGCMVQ